MKPLWCLLFCCSMTAHLGAQTPTLALTTEKTTSLVFPCPVRHVDRGNGDILVQPVRGAERILLVKAACEGFPETNLSVVTEDGSLYSFLVRYQKMPAVWTYEVAAKTTQPVAAYAARLVDNPPMLHGIRDRAWGVTATLQGLYIGEGTLYCQLRLENSSPIDYPIDYLRLAVRDRKKARRTAVQEVALNPLHISGRITGVKAFSTVMVVLALSTFTLPGQQYLAIEVGEKSGGRHLVLKVGNRQLLKAIPLPGGK
jgi:hypothetical protein